MLMINRAKVGFVVYPPDTFTRGRAMTGYTTVHTMASKGTVTYPLHTKPAYWYK
jgi:hypothetical protein